MVARYTWRQSAVLNCDAAPTLRSLVWDEVVVSVKKSFHEVSSKLEAAMLDTTRWMVVASDRRLCAQTSFRTFGTGAFPAPRTAFDYLCDRRGRAISQVPPLKIIISKKFLPKLFRSVFI